MQQHNTQRRTNHPWMSLAPVMAVSAVVVGLLATGTLAATQTEAKSVEAASKSAAPTMIKLWPNGAPDEPAAFDPRKVKATKKPNNASRVYFVTDPSITVYRPARDKANGCAIVVCPGGGYNLLAWDHEGTEVASWLNSLGVTAVLLKYRVPRRPNIEPHKLPMQDAQRAIRITRHHAKAWNLDADRLGILGFSAGGNLTVMTALHSETGSYKPVDEADKLSPKPNFMIPIYAAYLGGKDKPKQLNDMIKVDKNTPMMFTAVSQNDKDRGIHAALLFAAFRQAGVPAEAHIYSTGGHGYGMRKTGRPAAGWPDRCAEWLKEMKWLDK